MPLGGASMRPHPHSLLGRGERRRALRQTLGALRGVARGRPWGFAPSLFAGQGPWGVIKEHRRQGVLLGAFEGSKADSRRGSWRALEPVPACALCGHAGWSMSFMCSMVRCA